jgi:hypothetical protein
LSTIDWSELYANRKKISKRYKRIWDVPLAKRYHTVLFEHIRDNSSILEMGAGDRGLEKKIDASFSNVSYKSFDIDTKRFHDFYKLEDIEGQYDTVCMFEMIEHVTLQQAFDILTKAYQSLTDGGVVVISTPNIYYPPAFLRDVTHITPWCYDELGGVVSMTGFEVIAIFRQHHDSILKKFAKRWLFYPLYRLLGIDFSKQILVVGKKTDVSQ